MQIEQEKIAFDFETFKNQAIADMKAGKSLIGKEGVFTPLMKDDERHIKVSGGVAQNSLFLRW